MLLHGPDSCLSQEPSVFAFLVHQLHPSVPLSVWWETKSITEINQHIWKVWGNPWLDMIIKNRLFKSLCNSVLKSKFCETRREFPGHSSVVFFFLQWLPHRDDKDPGKHIRVFGGREMPNYQARAHEQDVTAQGPSLLIGHTSPHMKWKLKPWDEHELWYSHRWTQR